VFSVSHPSPTSQAVSHIPHIDIEDGNRYFELFRSKTSVDCLTHTSDVESIRLLLLQAGVVRPSIRYALAALGALEKVSEMAPALPYDDHWGTCSKHHRNALRLYNRAITYMKNDASSGEQDLRTTLMTCLLIICFEAWTGNRVLAIKQMQTGAGLVQAYRGENSGSRSKSGSSIPGIEENLVRVFAHFTTQVVSMTSSEERSPVCHDVLRNDVQDCLSRMPTKFTSIKVATEYKSVIMRYATYLLGTSLQKPPPPSFETVPPFSGDRYVHPSAVPNWDRHIAYVKQWLNAFKGLSKTLHAQGGNSMFESAIIKMHINMIYIYLIGALANNEMVYDDYFGELQEIVDLADMVVSLRGKNSKAATYTFENGLIASLQFAAQKCRYSVTRRKAIELLLTYPRREGLWDSTFAGKMMEWAVDIEEEYMENGSIPGWARITGIAKSENLQQRTATLKCRQRTSETSTVYVAREKVICW